MPVVNVPQRKQDVVSAVLRENITDSTGHYQVVNTWQVDATTLLPVGVTQQITLGA